jgi:hypothetical protein
MSLLFSLDSREKNGFQFVVIAMVLSFSTLQLEAQEMMTLGRRHKVELEGEKLNVGIAEVTVSMFAIDRGQLAFGITAGLAGGVVEAIISSRMKRIEQELELGVKAYNQCMLWR